MEGFQGKRRETEELQMRRGWEELTAGMGTKADKSAMQGLHLHQDRLNYPCVKKKRVGKTQ